MKILQKNKKYRIQEDKYSDEDIKNIAKSTLIDKELTEKLLNEKFIENDHEYSRFNNTLDVYKVIKASAIDKEYTLELLSKRFKYLNEYDLYTYKSDEIESLLESCKNYGKEKVKHYLNMTKFNWME